MGHASAMYLAFEKSQLHTTIRLAKNKAADYGLNNTKVKDLIYLNAYKHCTSRAIFKQPHSAMIFLMLRKLRTQVETPVSPDAAASASALLG